MLVQHQRGCISIIFRTKTYIHFTTLTVYLSVLPILGFGQFTVTNIKPDFGPKAGGRAPVFISVVNPRRSLFPKFSAGKTREEQMLPLTVAAYILQVL